VPVNVVIEGDIVGPGAGQQIAVIPIHDVALESEAQMVFDARPLDLRIPAEGKDIISDDIITAVMLMKSAVRGAVDQVVLGQNVGCAFVEICLLYTSDAADE